MTQAEALVHLNIDDAADAGDGFEAALFETKQFLLTKPVFLKTFHNRLVKLARQHEAFLALGGTAQQPTETIPDTSEASDDLMAHFSGYHAAKNKIRQQLSAANDAETLRTTTLRLIENERIFAEPFAAYTDWTEEQVTIGKEPDSMDVLALLKAQAANGPVTLAQLHSTKNNLPQELLLVLKRLSLLKNYLYE